MNMQSAVLGLLCLAGICHGRRVQSSRDSDSSVVSEVAMGSSASPSENSLAMLLSTVADPQAAFSLPQTAIRAHGSARSPFIAMKAKSREERVIVRNTKRNKMYGNEMKTRIKNVKKACDNGNYTQAVTKLSNAFQIMDKNVKRGFFKKNTAARRKAKLARFVQKLENGTYPVIVRVFSEKQLEKQRIKRERKARAAAKRAAAEAEAAAAGDEEEYDDEEEEDE